MLTLPSLRVDSHTKIVACAAPREESRSAFLSEFGGNAHESVGALARDPSVEAVYVATPHQMHREHAEILAAGGKHLLIEKPLAITLEDAEAIVSAVRRNGVQLITGPSHSFDQPVLLARDMIASRDFGDVRMITAINYTDFLYRPRRPEELDTSQGGGVVFSQAVHQVDVVRTLMGKRAESVFATTGSWDKRRPTEGAYSATVTFEGGSFATLAYSGYAHYDSDILQDGVGELGSEKDMAAYGKARKALSQVSSSEEEARLKSGRTYGAVDAPKPAPYAEHFGPVIISCDRADLRLTAKGVEVWGDFEKAFFPAPADPAPRSPVLEALYRAIRLNQPPIQSDGWGLASLEVCHAILESAATGQVANLTKQ
ncbi:MAG: Gfo/Idh/MocA family oxidoreductase [Nisaea sp.]|nr:Gfo/Idh/MocA family oxidoreductase [Nisaea sp.]